MEGVCTSVSKPVRRRFIPKSKRTPQLGKYTLLWDKIFNKWGWETKTESEKKALRHSINEDLFGTYTKPSLLTNEQWSVMFFALDLLLSEGILIWSKEMAALALEEGLRRIYIWWIEHAGLDVEGVEDYGAPEYYIAAIARDRFGGIADWRMLDSKRLWQLFITIKNRVKAAQKRGVSLWHGADAEAETSNNYPF